MTIGKLANEFQLAAVHLRRSKIDRTIWFFVNVVQFSNYIYIYPHSQYFYYVNISIRILYCPNDTVVCGNGACKSGPYADGPTPGGGRD